MTEKIEKLRELAGNYEKKLEKLRTVRCSNKDQGDFVEDLDNYRSMKSRLANDF